MHISLIVSGDLSGDLPEWHALCPLAGQPWQGPFELARTRKAVKQGPSRCISARANLPMNKRYKLTPPNHGWAGGCLR